MSIKEALALVKQIWESGNQSRLGTHGDMEDCPSLDLVNYMDGKEPDMFRKQELLSAETQDEISSPFLFFWVYARISSRRRGYS